MAKREFDFDNCTLDDIIEFSHRNYKRNKEEIDKKISESKQKAKSKEDDIIKQDNSDDSKDENLDKKSN